MLADEVERLRAELASAKDERDAAESERDDEYHRAEALREEREALEVRNTELTAERDMWRRLVMDPANVCGNEAGGDTTTGADE